VISDKCLVESPKFGDGFVREDGFIKGMEDKGSKLSIQEVLMGGLDVGWGEEIVVLEIKTE
jgi:hypothetical protein